MADEIEGNSEPESGEFILDGRYRILPHSTLPELALSDVQAVVARDDVNPGDNLFARICPPDGMPASA